jgi:hypothetical protein
MRDETKPNHLPPNSSADSAAKAADLEHRTKRTALGIGYIVARALRQHCATDSEQAALERMECFRGTLADIRALTRAAAMAQMPWTQLWTPRQLRGCDDCSGQHACYAENPEYMPMPAGGRSDVYQH